MEKQPLQTQDLSENSEYSENSENSDSSKPSPAAELSQLIAEAEERGYQRGRSEAAAASQPSAASQTDDYDSDDSCPSFLAHIRPGFWD